jgi:hypothetical protein
LNSEEDSNELSTKASSNGAIVPCALIKLKGAESNQSLEKKSSLMSEGIVF